MVLLGAVRNVALSVQGGQKEMSKENITRVTLEQAREMEDLTDWERVDNITEEEIEQNALDDPDNPPLTDEELEQFETVYPDQQSHLLR
jgi:hypothetical protein